MERYIAIPEYPQLEPDPFRAWLHRTKPVRITYEGTKGAKYVTSTLDPDFGWDEGESFDTLEAAIKHLK